MENGSSRRITTTYPYSDNEHGIILIGPTPAHQNLSLVRSTWSRSAQLDSIDLTENDNFDNDAISDKIDDKLKNIFNKGYSVDPYLQKLDCPICMESFVTKLKKGGKIMSTLCGHVFCFDCLSRAIKTSRKCPSCREIVNPNTKNKLYSHRLHLPVSIIDNA